MFTSKLAAGGAAAVLPLLLLVGPASTAHAASCSVSGDVQAQASNLITGGTEIAFSVSCSGDAHEHSIKTVVEGKVDVKGEINETAVNETATVLAAQETTVTLGDSTAAAEQKIHLAVSLATTDVNLNVTVDGLQVGGDICIAVGKNSCLVDEFIDADGIATAGDGLPEAVDVEADDVLTSFPAPGIAGLDMFDRNGDNAWTQGVDDLHSEGTGVCSTAIRDGAHQLGADCKVLDLNGDLKTGDRVTCDLEVGFSFGQNPCPPPNVTFFDANSNSTWESGEDLVLDTNGNGILD